MNAADQIHLHEPMADGAAAVLEEQSFTSRNANLSPISDESLHNITKSLSGRRQSITIRDNLMEGRKMDRDSSPKRGLGPRPVRCSKKLRMFSGVYVPTCLNVLSILMFLRFGFILGQGGVLGMMGMLIAAYAINLVTTFSLSAIASNGTVRGGGAYYLISRSLGPEFGGSIGVVFYLGFAFNTGMNAVGLIDCITLNFGVSSGNWAHILPDSFWYSYLWATVVLVICTAVCLAGSSMFARASTWLLVILLVATLSIPFSAIVMPAFESTKLGIEYTGLSLKTFMGNLKPQLTRGSAGSELHGKETFQDLFGILFPATGGIFAGASMSGDLRNPSKSIPKGTLYGLATTFVLYTLVILAMAATIARPSFARNSNVIQDTNISGVLILAGEIASSLFSTLMGVTGSAKLLQALARDSLLPGFSIFGQGTKKGDEPTYAILMTVIVAQIVILGDLNKIASFVTMTYLMTFLVMNLACFLLKIGSAPNFRPSFHFFNWQTALLGTVVSGAAMFFVDGLYATICVGILIVIFLIIHYTSPPKSWGDVSQSLIYHQVRKYLLRLKQEHVKFWRPQILLFVNDPRRQYKLIQFCNSMKKGSLYILGHVIVTDDFAGSVPEARRQQTAWTNYIDFSKIKAFVNIAISPGVEWGARNLVLSAGLGGMRPNIAVLGFYNLDDLRRSKPLVDIHQISPPSTGSIENQPRRRRDSKDLRMEGQLPTDVCKTEGMMSVTSYVTILEDLLLQVQINVAVAKGFQSLEFPNSAEEHTKKYIDLWPIQMSAEIYAEENGKQNVLTTNFDTYTLILQLGVILNTVPAWKKAYKVRVAVFVEYENDVAEERSRVQALLENLRIEAEILVFWLASGDLPTYEVIINGATMKEAQEEVDQCLSQQSWWDEIQKLRGNRAVGNENLFDLTRSFSVGTSWPEPSFQKEPRSERAQSFLGLRRLLKRSRRRQTASGIAKLGVNLGMRTHSLSQQLAKRHASIASASEDSASGSEDESDSGASGHGGFGAEVDFLGGPSSEADMDDYQSDGDSVSEIQERPMIRRKSHGDSMRGPPPSKKSTGERDVKVPDTPSRIASRKPSIPTSSIRSPVASAPTTPLKATAEAPGGQAPPIKERDGLPQQQKKSHPTASDHLSHLRPDTLSRHASMPKFSSKPVPETSVATEDGPERSIMFTETPAVTTKRSRLPSAYHTSSSIPDNISEASEQGPSSQSRRGSAYSTQAIPLSFNDLPSRAQHLILNELMRSQSQDTAVMFTTLPTPIKGACKSETASAEYLGDLEVLCKGCPPVLMVHSNSMTVTMSL